jgi:4-hydroxybenzoate polyprenyltransferase
LRPPNLFTVPGDPLAGAMLAAGVTGLATPWHALLGVSVAALLLYAAGLLSNDYFDRAIDARERPDRPIPSGAVSATSVVSLAILLTGVALLLALRAGGMPFSVALLLAMAVWFYNGIGKRHPGVAPFAMGLCRALSLVMGAAVMGTAGLIAGPVVVSALALMLVIALITALARNEASTTGIPISPLLRWGIPAALTGWMGTGWYATVTQSPGLALILAAMSILWSLVWIIPLKKTGQPRRVQAAVGGLIRGLLFTQAALCAFSGREGEGVALLLIVAFPVSGWLGKWFYGS